jgi:glucan-binding YG repeat protein
MYQQQPQHQQKQHLEYLKAEIDRINRQNAEEKKRIQLKEIIPAHPFINPSTGEFNEAKFQTELERRVKSNMTVEEIAEMYDVNLETCNNNKNDNQQRYVGKTASSPSSTANNSLWFLDMFESNY